MFSKASLTPFAIRFPMAGEKEPGITRKARRIVTSGRAVVMKVANFGIDMGFGSRFNVLESMRMKGKYRSLHR